MAIYRVDQNQLVEVPKTDFGSQGILERQDLQRLLKSQIQVLSPDLMVIAEEFGEWEDSNRRIDLLCLDREANIVVVELKRTQDGGHMELQAIRYAAMVSTMSFTQLVEAHSRLAGGQELAREAILNFLNWNDIQEDLFAQNVKIILASADFGRELTTAVLWLNQWGLDIQCIRLKPHRMNDGTLLLNVQQIIPLPEAADFQTRIATKERRERDQRSNLTQSDALARASEPLRVLWGDFRSYVLGLSSNITEQETRVYTGFVKNGTVILSGRVYPGARPHLKLWLKLNPDLVDLEEGFSRDVRNIGHWGGRCDVEVTLVDTTDLGKVKPLLLRCYQEG